MITTNKEIIADEGKYLHIVNTNAYFTKCMITSNLPQIEEVDSKPEETNQNDEEGVL